MPLCECISELNKGRLNEFSNYHILLTTLATQWDDRLQQDKTIDPSLGKFACDSNSTDNYSKNNNIKITLYTLCTLLYMP